MKKRILSVVMSVIMLFSSISFIGVIEKKKIYAAPAITGSGTQGSPYLVISEEQLAAIASGEFYNNFEAYYRLGNNITLTATNWTPIGDR